MYLKPKSATKVLTVEKIMTNNLTRIPNIYGALLQTIMILLDIQQAPKEGNMKKIRDNNISIIITAMMTDIHRADH